MHTLSRRKFGLGVGAGLIAGSLLAGLGRAVRADGANTAKRLVVFFSPNGTIHSHWRPTGTETSFSFPAGSILEPLAKHQGDIIVCDGINFKDVANHNPGMHAMLTGGGGASSSTGGMSLDQFVASKIGQSDKFPSLDLGVLTNVWGSSEQTRMSYSAPDVRVEPDDDPTHVFKRMFGDVTGNPMDVDKALARRKSVLDLVRGEITTLRGRVGKDEQAKLDQHLDALRKVELGLQGPTGASCTTPMAPAALGPRDNGSFPQIGKSHMDLLVLALACGMTKVASIQWSHTVSPVVFGWESIGDDHHSLSHSDDGNASGVANFVKAERWFAGQFAYLLDQLKATPDPLGGTLFDNTQVVWCKELGDSRLHDCNSVPFVLAGGKYFKPGRYMQFGGAPHQKLLVSICQALGLQNQTFGDPSKGTGPLEGLA